MTLPTYRRGLLLLAVCCSLAAGLALAPIVTGQERVDLTTPIAKPSTSSCALDTLLLDRPNQRIAVTLTCNNGDPISHQWDSFTTPTGASLLAALNKANLTTRSLTQRIYDRLILDKVLVGSVTGAVP